MLSITDMTLLTQQSSGMLKRLVRLIAEIMIRTFEHVYKWQEYVQMQRITH